MRKMFISENSKTEVIGNKDVSVKYIAFANSVNINKSMANHPNADLIKIVNMNIIIKTVLESKVQILTKEQVMQNNELDVKNFSENMQINLSEIPVPSFELKNFKSSMELQDAIEDYYFEQGLKKSVFGIINWIEKK